MIVEWELGLNEKCQAVAGLGLPHTASFQSAQGLHNGQAHVLIYIQSNGDLSLYVNGPFNDNTPTKTDIH